MQYAIVRAPQVTWTYRPLASLLLVSIVLAICIGPRLRLGALGDRAIDVRVQDLLLVVALVYLAFSVRPAVRSSMRAVWGNFAGGFVAVAVLGTCINVLTNDDVGLLRRVLFLGRALELIVLAAVVAALYLRAGPSALRSAIRALYVAVFVNVSWFIYQLATGTRQTLLGDTLGEDVPGYVENALIESYGPKLIGEPSPFGTGAFFIMMAALAIAEHKTTRRRPIWTLTALLLAFVGATLAESRIAMVVILVLSGLLAVRPVVGRPITPLPVSLAVLVGVATASWYLSRGQYYVSPIDDGRLSPAGIGAGLASRVDEIWGPLFSLALDNFAFGVGPGGLTFAPPLDRSEAHNILLRAWLDWGVVGALLFVGVFATCYVRARRVIAAADDIRSDPVFTATLVTLVMPAFVIAGMVQDSFTAVMTTHLLMMSIGLFAGALAARERPLS